MKNAMKGLAALRDAVDTLIVIPNQRLLAIANKNMSLLEAFREADAVLFNAVKGVSDLITIPGLVNVDFADVRTMAGFASGDGRASKAAQQAISSPLLEDTSIDGARGILVNLTGGESLGIMEINEAITLVQEAAHADANIIFGAVIDPNVGDEIRITVVATGFDQVDEPAQAQYPGHVQQHVPQHASAHAMVHEAPAPMMSPPPELPPLAPEPFADESPFVTTAVGAGSRAGAGGAADAGDGRGQRITGRKPWATGGLSLGDITGGKKAPARSPFQLPPDSEFGSGGYPFKTKR
jgi:cell division protein FtsZ